MCEKRLSRDVVVNARDQDVLACHADLMVGEEGGECGIHGFGEVVMIVSRCQFGGERVGRMMLKTYRVSELMLEYIIFNF